MLAILVMTFFLRSNAQVSASISFQTFYDDLSPYGTWIEYPGEGYVWSPYAGADFRPYGSRGHWVYTEDGWAWVSNYEWGWAPFHYGRWIYDDIRGWLWVPGYDWAPACVTWGYHDGCYGWSPLGIDFRADYVGYRPPATWWTFVGASYITSTAWHSHVYGGWSARPRTTIINNTTIVNNNITVINNVATNNERRGGTWMRGPKPNDVQRFTHIAIRPVVIAALPKPGADRISGNHISMYRPVVNKVPTNNVMPSRVENFDKFRSNTKPANVNNAQSNAARPSRDAENNRPIERRPIPSHPNNAPPNTMKSKPNAEVERPIKTKPPEHQQNNPPINRPVHPDRALPNNKPEQPNNPPRHQPLNPPPNVLRPVPTRDNKPPQMQHNNKPNAVQQRSPAQQMKRPPNPPPAEKKNDHK